MKKRKTIASLVMVIASVFFAQAMVWAGQLTLAWNPSPSPAVGYRLYWGTSSGNYSQSANAGNIDHYTVDGLAEGETYYFVVTAYDISENESDYSEELSYAMPSSAIVIEDGEDATNWVKTSGSGLVTSIFDFDVSESGSDVLAFGSTSATILSAYRVPLSGSDISNKNITWKCKYLQALNSFFVVNISSTFGARNIYYRPLDTSTLGASTNIFYGIGIAMKDGAWHTVLRNLQADLKAAQPTNNLLSINYFYVYVYGSGDSLLVDDVSLSATE
ncbi:MAG: hypothetical protein QG620_813 [Patescibacteria group bacterium]|nr:hypothetical protein [Patescibacteria group bacterium]